VTNPLIYPALFAAFGLLLVAGDLVLAAAQRRASTRRRAARRAHPSRVGAR